MRMTLKVPRVSAQLIVCSVHKVFATNQAANKVRKTGGADPLAQQQETGVVIMKASGALVC